MKYSGEIDCSNELNNGNGFAFGEKVDTYYVKSAKCRP
jgi:hypothetical protein